MKIVPKVVNKLPIYLLIIILFGVAFFVLTGKFKLEVVNVSANTSDVSNYIKVTTLENQTIGEILTSPTDIGLVASPWCSNCNVLTIELKNFLQKNPTYKVYEFDLDSSRSLLRDISADSTPTLIIPRSTQFEVKPNITLQDLKDTILTEFGN
ncbi:MAG: thioredoxin domain-containing protein [Candidatus Dojkabacteria bacterium]